MLSNVDRKFLKRVILGVAFGHKGPVQGKGSVSFGQSCCCGSRIIYRNTQSVVSQYDAPHPNMEKVVTNE